MLNVIVTDTAILNDIVECMMQFIGTHDASTEGYYQFSGTNDASTEDYYQFSGTHDASTEVHYQDSRTQANQKFKVAYKYSN